MDLRQLEYFVAVAEHANFTRAAASLHVSQPGVSAQIRRMERELGQPLLDRAPSGVRLTQVGHAVLPYARAALAAASGARNAVEHLTGLLRGRVNVGMVTACAFTELFELLADFHRRYPAVELALTEGSSDRMVESVVEGRLDVALIGLATEAPPGIATALVADEPLMAAAPRTDALVKRGHLPIEALRDRPLICLPRGTGLRAALDRACSTAGFLPQVAFEAGSPNVLAQLAIRGLGVAVVPESTARAHAPKLWATVIGRPAVRSRLELAWKTEGGTSPAAQAFIFAARAALTDEGPRRA